MAKTMTAAAVKNPARRGTAGDPRRRLSRSVPCYSSQWSPIVGDALSAPERQASQAHARSGRPVWQGGRERTGTGLAAYAGFGEKACRRDPPPARYGSRCDRRLRRLQAPAEVRTRESRQEHVPRRRERLHRAIRQQEDPAMARDC